MAVRLSSRATAALSLGAGLATPLAFAPYGWWPLAILCPAILLAVLEGSTRRQGALAGWLYGVGLLGHGVWWLQVSIHQFGVPYYLFSAGMTALFVLAMALYYAAFGAGLALAGRNPFSALVFAPALWTCLELLRGWFLSGFPWLTLGYSQLESPLANLAPVLGVGGTSLAVMVLSAGLVRLVRGPGRERGHALLALAIVAAGVYAAGRFDFTRSVDRDLQAALVQGAIPQAVKWDPRLRAASIEHYEALSAAHWQADVLNWPETAITAFPQQVPDVLARLRRRAEDTATTLLVGMPTGEPDAGRYFNSLLALGAEEGRYDKRHLVPFGEFFPLESIVGGLARLLDIPMSDFSAGDADNSTLPAAGHQAGISICYEDAFGRETIAALPAAGFLVNVSNDAWFGDTIAPHQHLEIARMRALETGRYLLRATNNGITAIIDHAGRVTARAEQFEPRTLAGRFEIRSGATPYVLWGDWPVIVLCALVVGFTMPRLRAAWQSGE